MNIKENVTVFECEHCKKRLFVRHAMALSRLNLISKYIIMEWENIIQNLILIAGKSGIQPNRIVVNNFTYQLISEEFARKEILKSSRNFLGLRVHIDDDYSELNKIVIEIDNL